MPSFRTDYGNTEGPLGFPMPDRQARTLDTLLKSLPRTREYQYRHTVVAKAPTELNPGERSDVSWISTESVDRTAEVVLARGMNDSQFQQNPLVTLQHAYHLAPVGRSLWRKRVKDGSPPHGTTGIKAKTVYPARPTAWDEQTPWPPDKVFALVQSGLLNGKSIGFLPTRVHVPGDEECRKKGWEGVALVIDEWLLLEYACVFLPANQDALVESVSKGLDVPEDLLQALGLDLRSIGPRAGGSDAPAVPNSGRVIPFTPLEEVGKAVERAVNGVDYLALAEECAQSALDRLRGRV